MVLLRRHLKEFFSLADPCRKHWPCVMTAHDVNKKLQAGNILLCRRRLREGLFIRGGGGVNYWRGAFMLSTKVDSGFIGDGGFNFALTLL